MSILSQVNRLPLTTKGKKKINYIYSYYAYAFCTWFPKSIAVEQSVASETWVYYPFTPPIIGKWFTYYNNCSIISRFPKETD